MIYPDEHGAGATRDSSTAHASNLMKPNGEVEMVTPMSPPSKKKKATTTILDEGTSVMDVQVHVGVSEEMGAASQLHTAAAGQESYETKEIVPEAV